MKRCRFQISQMLTHRVASYDLMWGRDITEPYLSTDLHLSLENSSVRAAIQQFNFIEMKRESVGPLASSSSFAVIWAKACMMSLAMMDWLCGGGSGESAL